MQCSTLSRAMVEPSLVDSIRVATVSRLVRMTETLHHFTIFTLTTTPPDPPKQRPKYQRGKFLHSSNLLWQQQFSAHFFPNPTTTTLPRHGLNRESDETFDGFLQTLISFKSFPPRSNFLSVTDYEKDCIIVEIYLNS